jgi:hypothetical protein
MNLLANVFILAMLAVIVFTPRALSQNTLNGSYKFATRQHVKGPEYGNGVPTSIAIDVTKDSVIISYGSIENEKETISRSAFAGNGKPVQTKVKTSGRKVIRTVKWADDKKSFTTTSEIYKEDNDDEIELTRIDDFTLSADGKQLLFHRRSVETITESWEDNATYNKN